MYHSLTEIFGQGESLARTYAYVMGRRREIEAFFASAPYEEALFLGCGSSYWSSLSSCVTFQRATGVKASAATSGDVLMNIDTAMDAYRKPVLILPSRSGSTSETVEVAKRFRAKHACRALSITEYGNSPVAALSDLNLFIPWANETSVCQTRSFSNLYLAEMLVAAIAGRDEGLLAEFGRYTEAAGRLLSEAKPRLESLVREFSGCSALVTLGNGAMLGAAIEGAYIAIEMASFPSNYYPVLELRHGPIVMCGKNTLVAVFSGGNRVDLDENMARDARAKGSRVLHVGARPGFANCDYSFSLGFEAGQETVGLFGVAVMQGFAHFKSVALGLDPDNPSELVPWIRI